MHESKIFKKNYACGLFKTTDWPLVPFHIQFTMAYNCHNERKEWDKISNRIIRRQVEPFTAYSLMTYDTYVHVFW